MTEKVCPKCGDRGVIIRDGHTAVVCSCAGKARMKNLARRLT